MSHLKISRYFGAWGESVSRCCVTTYLWCSCVTAYLWCSCGRLLLKCDGTRAETRFRLSAKRTSPFKSAGPQFSRLLAADLCASGLVMLDTPCSEVVWRVLATHSIRQFPPRFSSRASPCAITFQLDSTQFLILFLLSNLRVLGFRCDALRFFVFYDVALRDWLLGARSVGTTTSHPRRKHSNTLTVGKCQILTAEWI